MFRLTLSALRAKKARVLLSAAAIALGVAFMAGTLVLTATLGHAYDQLSTKSLQGTDAVVRSDRVATSADNDSTVRGTVDDKVLAALRGVPGVAAAEPRIEGVAQLIGTDGRLLDADRGRATPIAFGWYRDADLNPMELVSGSAPTTVRDIVIDVRSARDDHLAVGDRVGVLTATGSGRYRIAGIATYGGADDAAGAHVVAFSPAAASVALGPPGAYQSIQVAGSPGVTEHEVVANIEAALRSVGVTHVEAVTGADAIAEAKADSQEQLQFLNVFLMSFAFVSLLVGSFVIANAFSITVAQRTRENVLLRAIGASKRQVVRAVVVESVITGVIASLVGVVLGIGAAGLLKVLLAWFGLDLPAAPLVVPPSVFVVGVVVGTVVTVLASYLPARRSAKVAPVAAMRDVALDHSGSSTVRVVVGTLVVLAGALLLVIGLAGAGVAAVGLGAVACFFGVAVLGPVIAPPAARVLGAPLRRLSGITGSIATENARRNPKRTAATVSSLMIGLGLVAFITIVGASVQTSFASTVDDALAGDWIVSTVFSQGGVSPDLAGSIDALPETAAVSGVRYTAATQAGKPIDVSGVDPADIDQLVDLDLRSGRIGALGADGVAVQADVAKAHGWSVGDDISVSFPETGARALRLVAVYGTQDPLGDYAVSTATFDANVADPVDMYVLVADAPGVSTDQASKAMQPLIAGYPTVELQTGKEFASGVTSEIVRMLNLVYALLALAVVIALFGIANTLALSVHERTRELGLLRAVGMGRRQLRGAVRSESVIISLLGTAMGLVVGTGFAVALVVALKDEGFSHLVVPTVPLLSIVLVGIAAGVLSAVLPARRAAGLDVLVALHAD